MGENEHFDMYRQSLTVLVAAGIVVLAEVRIGEPRLARLARPSLWENTSPPGKPSPPATVFNTAAGLIVAHPPPTTNCATLISTESNSRFALTAPEQGVSFDIDGDGDVEQVAWTESGTDVAFLVLDANSDGRITNGRELIGDHTLPDVTDPLEALLRLADQLETTAVLDARNPLFARLRLWRDTNHNGVSEHAELRAAPDDLSGIGLGYEIHRRIDNHGNQSRFRGFVRVRTASRESAEDPSDHVARHRYMYVVCLMTK